MVQAVQSESPEEAAKALEGICREYWFPIYAYLRRSGRSPHDAEDLTQAFFERLIDGKALQAVKRERGRLRNYLLHVLVQLLSDVSRSKNALKRGGGKAIVSFDEMAAEELYHNEPRDTDDPEKIYLHAWAGGLIHRSVLRLRATFESEGKLEMFEILRPWLGDMESQPPYEELAQKLSSNAGAVRVLVHRLRKNLRKALEREIAKTVMSPDEVSEELDWLKRTLAE